MMFSYNMESLSDPAADDQSELVTGEHEKQRLQFYCSVSEFNLVLRSGIFTTKDFHTNIFTGPHRKPLFSEVSPLYKDCYYC